MFPVWFIILSAICATIACTLCVVALYEWYEMTRRNYNNNTRQEGEGEMATDTTVIHNEEETENEARLRVTKRVSTELLRELPDLTGVTIIYHASGATRIHADNNVSEFIARRNG